MSDRRIVEYRVVWCNSEYGEKALSELVNEVIAEGWQPIGGVAVEQPWEGQAMVRYETKEQANES